MSSLHELWRKLSREPSDRNIKLKGMILSGIIRGKLVGTQKAQIQGHTKSILRTLKPINRDPKEIVARSSKVTRVLAGAMKRKDHHLDVLHVVGITMPTSSLASQIPTSHLEPHYHHSRPSIKRGYMQHWIIDKPNNSWVQ